MVNPFTEIDWNPDRLAVKAFGRIVVIVSVIVAPVAFGLFHFLDKGFFLFLCRLFSVFLVLGVISFILPAIGRYIYKVWYFLSACIGLVVTNVILLLFFFAFFTPIALFMRYLTRRDPLTLKQPDKTMWTDHAEAKTVARYYRQY
ncbi:MAG: hypothetical protein ACI9R3_004261 [Verrucomicrobiales bacterium]|jgi:hypothetical protein